MFYKIKALIVVLTIAAIVFRLTKPIALQFISGEDFSRRRLMWFVLTTTSFICPNIWLYALVAVPLLLWANRKESNSIALYLAMLHVIPPAAVIIPILGNNGLFTLDNYRLLAFCVLIPATMRYRKNSEEATTGRLGGMDILLLAYGALEIALYIPPDLPQHSLIPDSPSNVLRRAFLFFLDTYLLYFAISRLCQSRRKLVDAVATFCLFCAVMAAIAIFERMRGWLLYVELASSWGNDPRAAFYLFRGGSVRAQASAGHSISLGHVLAVAFGFWLYLKSRVQNRIHRIGGTLLLAGGLFATFSRGAWLSTLTIYFVFIALGPRKISRLFKGASLALVAGGLVAVSPVGDQILALLPTMGKPADSYRHRLAERGWQLVFQHPFFGDQFPWPEMEDLRQGEGIIDIVNTYLGVALNYGLIGLALFLGFILYGMMSAYMRVRELAQSDPDLALFGTSLVACIVGTLIMIDSSSFQFGCVKMFYLLAGLATAYARMIGSSSRGSGVLDANNVEHG